METQNTERLKEAQALMALYAKRTGLEGDELKTYNRYLWTDAYALQTFLGLAEMTKEENYREKALLLTELVHKNLGRFIFADSRKGWISGLSEEEGKAHPTAGGLRIGKSLRERKESEDFNERLEWERDGQYFHYNTRWAHSLMEMAEVTGNSDFRRWAAELLLASEKFIQHSNGTSRMYWKMSIDLSRPQVATMGAHDPLEGLILSTELQEKVPELASHLGQLASRFENLSRGMDWKTTDTLGLGGLLIHSVKAAECALKQPSIPEAMNPQKLLNDCRKGLDNLLNSREFSFTSARRLAFRECGLSLGLRVLFGKRTVFEAQNIDLRPLEEFLPLAEEIEDFWLEPGNQDSVLWKKHPDINAVALAASLIADIAPKPF